MSTRLTISFSSLRSLLSNRLSDGGCFFLQHSDGGCCIALGGWPKVRVWSWESALEFRAIELIIFSIPTIPMGKVLYEQPCACWYWWINSWHSL